MDATKKPLNIPADYSNYATEHNIFELFQFMLQELLINRPKDPLSFLLDLLDQPTTDVPKIIIYGPPASGQHTVSKAVAHKLRAVHIRPSVLLEDNEEEKMKKLEELSPVKMAKLLWSRIQKQDCKTKGWIIEGYPRTREQTLALQTEGIIAQHFVHLQASNDVLLQRYAGKRVDPITGDIYHLVFDPPSDPRIMERLQEEEGGIEKNMHDKLHSYHRHHESVLKCYQHILRSFCADQPVNDLLVSVNGFLNTHHRSASPHTPRVILLGATGSGKSWQASQLASKYRLVDVDCRLLLKQALVSETTLAEQMKPFHDNNMPIYVLIVPDDMVMQVLSHRLSQVDCATRGWVLHGFPQTREQAELLSNSGYHPYRVMFLDVPLDIIKERLCLRRVDPVTGDRYHLLYQPPLSVEIQERLLIHPKDTEEAVESRVSQYNSNVRDLQDYYTTGQYVNADQDPYTVLEALESIIVNPLPKASPKSENPSTPEL